MARIQISNDSSGRIIVSFPYDPLLVSKGEGADYLFEGRNAATLGNNRPKVKDIENVITSFGLERYR